MQYFFFHVYQTNTASVISFGLSAVPQPGLVLSWGGDKRKSTQARFNPEASATQNPI